MKVKFCLLLVIMLSLAAPKTFSHPSITGIDLFQKKKAPKKTLARKYIRGPRGGCYYINANGNKTYVDRSICN